MYEAISYGRTVDAGTVAVAESHGLSTAAADRQPKHLNPNLVAGFDHDFAWVRRVWAYRIHSRFYTEWIGTVDFVTEKS